jgi:hypothetical protein
VVCGALCFGLAGVLVVRRFVRERIGSGHNDVASAIFQVAGTIYAVFLAFLVVTVWEAHDAARDNVANEASLLSTLYRGSTAMDPASGARLRLIIRTYTRDVTDDEWSLQARKGATSPRAMQDALDMCRLFGTIPAPARQIESSIDSAELGVIDQILADRNRRTLEARSVIPPMIWSVVIFNGVLVVVMSFFLYPDRLWPHLVMSSVLAIMVSTFICVVFIFERPFGGLLPLHPDAFAHSAEVFDVVDRQL